MAKSGSNEKKTPWWVLVLKVIAYAIGLILAGYATPAALTSVISLGGIN